MSQPNPPLSDKDQAVDSIQITFDSEDSRVEGWFFPANGSGTFPTAILLHGFPVEGQSPLDLGPALMSALVEHQVQNSTLEEHILPVFRALQSSGAEKLHIEILDDDHSFRMVRKDLSQRLITWIKST